MNLPYGGVNDDIIVTLFLVLFVTFVAVVFCLGQKFLSFTQCRGLIAFIKTYTSVIINAVKLVFSSTFSVVDNLGFDCLFHLYTHLCLLTWSYSFNVTLWFHKIIWRIYGSFNRSLTILQNWVLCCSSLQATHELIVGRDIGTCLISGWTQGLDW
jgi:hypothetical protein